MESFSPELTTEQATTARADWRSWLGLATLALPTLLLAIDVTVLHLAMPHLTADLNATSTQLLWIVDIYGFMIAGLLVVMGAAGDRIGRRRLLLLGSAGFGLASAMAAYSSTSGMLITARAMQGVAAATLMPSTLSLIRNLFRDERQRGFAIAIWNTVFMAGAAIGPLVGGALLEYFWWGSVFLINLPIMLLILMIGPFLLPEERQDDTRRLDLPSAGLFLTAALGLVYAIKHIAAEGATLDAGIALLLGTASAVTFIQRQMRLDDPLVDFNLFRRVRFSAALATQFLAIFALAAPYFMATQFLQVVLKLSPLQAGLWMLPSTLAGIVAALSVPGITTRVRPALVIAAALAIAFIGCGVLTQVSADEGVASLIAGLALMLIGVSGTTTLTVNIIISSAPPERVGEASGLSETTGEFGMAMGLAIVGSITTALYRAGADADGPSDHFADPILATGSHLFASGLNIAAIIGGCIMFTLIGVALLCFRQPAPPTDES